MREPDETPSPLEFDKYLPYACYQMGIDDALFVTQESKNLNSPLSGRSKVTGKISKLKTREASENLESADTCGMDSLIGFMLEGQHYIHIKTLYDPVTNDLIQITFSKNHHVPDVVLKIIALIAKFHPHLTSIVIDKGLHQQGLYELSKLISQSNITDLILDNNVIPQANYYILFDVTSFLNYLSLARCSINDIAIEKLLTKLQTSSLSILNVSSNKITDEGAMTIGKFLRQNRKLLYLNLAGNMITDEGANSILTSLMEHRVSAQDIYEKKLKYFTSEMEKKKILDSAGQAFIPDAKKITAKKIKSSEPTELIQGTFIENIEADVTQYLFKKDGIYSYGNNILSYLNLAYNNLGYFSVKKLLDVLRYQDRLMRTPRGLINVCIEGNNIPSTCSELMEIGYIITSIVGSATARATQKRRK